MTTRRMLGLFVLMMAGIASTGILFATTELLSSSTDLTDAERFDLSFAQGASFAVVFILFVAALGELLFGFALLSIAGETIDDDDCEVEEIVEVRE